MDETRPDVEDGAEKTVEIPVDDALRAKLAPILERLQDEPGVDYTNDDDGWGVGVDGQTELEERPLTKEERRALLLEYVRLRDVYGRMSPEQMREAENSDCGQSGSPSHLAALEQAVQDMVTSGEVVKETVTAEVNADTAIYMASKLWVGVVVDKWVAGCKVDEFNNQQPIPVMQKVVEVEVDGKMVKRPSWLPGIEEAINTMIVAVQQGEARREADA